MITKGRSVKRLFVGVPVEGEVWAEIERVVRALQRKKWKMRWEAPEKWHVTMAFIGKVSEVSRVSRVSKVLRSITKNRYSFHLKIKGLGQFPMQKKMKWGRRIRGRNEVPIAYYPTRQLVLPNIVWLGLKGEVQQLDCLAKEVRDGLQNAGINYDSKAFRPHITLGRVDKEASVGERIEMAKTVGKMRDLDMRNDWVARSVVLYESLLTQAGSRYEVIDEVELRDRK